MLNLIFTDLQLYFRSVSSQLCSYFNQPQDSLQTSTLFSFRDIAREDTLADGKTHADKNSFVLG